MSDRSAQPHRRTAGRDSGRGALWHRLTAALALLAAAAAIAVVALSAGAGTSSPPHTASGTTAVSTTRTGAAHKRTSAKRVAPRIVGLARLTLALREPSSASIATGQSPSGQPVRDLPTIVLYPVVRPRTARLRFPLVVFSQGYDSSATEYLGLLRAWAKAGYVVAAPTYPLTDPSAPGGINESDIVNHPADLRFVIAALRAAGRGPHGRLHAVLNPREVAITGQSDGGDVSLAVAANSCCHDGAVKAAMILSGAELAAFGGSYYSGVARVPMLVIQGTGDTINVPGCSAQLYDQAPQPKYYLGITGAGHLPPYVHPGPVMRGVESVTIAFLDAFLKHHRAPLAGVQSRLPKRETLTRAGTVPGIVEVCPGSP